mmetsp:Transcript_8215/g.17905  ORF Transcript_8215/g.17905 Transcript_8215/m.17905 type:complete len:253 (+) Transcript_8215:184-942(+)
MARPRPLLDTVVLLTQCSAVSQKWIQYSDAQNCAGRLAAAAVGGAGRTVERAAACLGGARVGEQSGVLQDLGDHFVEHLRDALLRLSTGLHEQHAARLGPLLSLFPRHDALLVHLVAHEQLDHLLAAAHAELLHLLQPHAQAVEGLLAGHVVDQDDPLRASVVRTRQRAEALLASGVPNRRLDLLGIPVRAVSIYHLHLEVNTDRALEVLIKVPIRELKKYARLPYCCIANKQNLENVVEVTVHSCLSTKRT